MLLLRSIRILRLQPLQSSTRALMSSLPGAPSTSPPTSASSSSSQPTPSSTLGETTAFFDDLLDIAPKPTEAVESDNSLPPIGIAYPPSKTNNPISASKYPQDTQTREKLEKSRYRLHVTATRNNTLTTFTRPDGGVIVTFTGGRCGFKGSKRNSYEAGYQCAVRIFQEIMKEHETVPGMRLNLFFSGFGQGRDATYRALMATEGEEVRPLVQRVTDVTPIKIGGTRSQKMRRN